MRLKKSNENKNRIKKEKNGTIKSVHWGILNKNLVYSKKNLDLGKADGGSVA